ncbi:MAG: hypothetical protein AB8G77_19825 [Rhodothermales bacterium]
MSSRQLDDRRRAQLLAMRDASAGAFEAARIKYLRLRKHAESVSLDYVCGNCDAVQVRAVAEQMLEAEFIVSEAARRTRLYQATLDKPTASIAPSKKPQPVSKPSRRSTYKHTQILKPAYLELLTAP